MSQDVFNSMELDAIGELMNISLGSSATAVSNMLDHRVDITTPKVQVVSVDDFSLGDLEPAIGIEIKYVSGLEGSNIMLLKRNDVKVIVDILMGSETPDEEFELNELTISAVCEVMNQMMGAASTALSDFLGYPVNISTPQSFALDDLDTFKKEHFPASATGDLVVVHRQPVARHGEIVVALIEDEATVKRLSLKNGQVWLMPENDAYSPIDGTYAQILGKVAAVVRRY